MSIYCSFFDFDEHKPRCKRMNREGKGSYSYDESKPCTCKVAPIKYQGSHILPSDKDERTGDLGFAAIPSHITRDGRDDRPEGQWHPWLRFHLSGGYQDSVVLDMSQVVQLRDAINRWLERATVRESQ